MLSFSLSLSRIREWEAAVRLYEKEYPDEKTLEYEKGDMCKQRIPAECVIHGIELRGLCK